MKQAIFGESVFSPRKLPQGKAIKWRMELKFKAMPMVAAEFATNLMRMAPQAIFRKQVKTSLSWTSIEIHHYWLEIPRS